MKSSSLIMDWKNFDPSSINVAEISRKGGEIYENIKAQYEPLHNGKHLAIHPDTGEVFLGADSHEAIQKAKSKYPDVIFYLVKVGHRAVASLSSLYEYV